MIWEKVDIVYEKNLFKLVLVKKIFIKPPEVSVIIDEIFGKFKKQFEEIYFTKIK